MESGLGPNTVCVALQSSTLRAAGGGILDVCPCVRHGGEHGTRVVGVCSECAGDVLLEVAASSASCGCGRTVIPRRVIAPHLRGTG